MAQGFKPIRVRVRLKFHARVMVHFKVAGVKSFTLDLAGESSINDIKKALQDESNIEPEHMRLLCNDQVLKGSATLESYDVKADDTIQILYTAGHTALEGGGQLGMSGGSTGQPGERLRGQAQLSTNP